MNKTPAIEFLAKEVGSQDAVTPILPLPYAHAGNPKHLPDGGKLYPMCTETKCACIVFATPLEQKQAAKHRFRFLARYLPNKQQMQQAF